LKKTAFVVSTIQEICEKQHSYSVRFAFSEKNSNRSEYEARNLKNRHSYWIQLQNLKKESFVLSTIESFKNKFRTEYDFAV